MAEDEPEKNETEAVAAPVLAVEDEEGRKTPDGVAPSDPSPPRLAPEAPTTSAEKKDEETEEEKKDDKPPLSMPISPPDEPPTLVRAAPQPQTSPPPQLLPAPPPPPPQQAVQPPPQITPHAPPQGKPRGRPPGVPNRATVVANQQAAMHKQQQAAVAHQMAQMMHHNGHTMHMGPVMMQDGQFVQMMQGQPGQPQMIQIINGNMQGRPRFNVPQIQQRPPPNQQQRPPQNAQNGGPNGGGLVPVLIPVTPGQAPNPIPVPLTALVKHPDGSYHLRPDFLPKAMNSATLQVPFVGKDGKQEYRQVQLAPNQMAMMQNMMKGQQMGMHQQLIFQQRGGGGDMPHLQQQLTRQNLPHQDRLATTSSAAAATTSAAANRTSDWVGGLPPPGHIMGGIPSTSMSSHPISQPHGVPYWSPPLHPEVIEMDDEDKEAAPQLHAEGTDRNLNMESLNAEEAFHKESQGGSGRKKKDRNAHKAVIETHEVDGFKVYELPEPTNSSHLDATDFEPVNEDDDDQSDKSYEGKDEDGSSSRRQTNGAGAVLGHQALEWMQNRLEMDIPRDERKPKVTPPPQKPSTRSDGKKIKRGKQKANELKSLLQMDFGPAENSRRAKEMLPVVINTAETAKTRAEMLKETPKQNLRGKERRSNSAAGGSVAPSTSGKETRSLRQRDSIEKLKECKACGKSIDEKKGKKQHAGYCNNDCCESSPLYQLLVSGKNLENRIATSASPSNSDEDDDDRTSVTTDQTPEPTSSKKESSTAPTSGSKRVIKEEPVEETTSTTTPKRKGRTTKKEEEVVTPKKDITPKKNITPKKDAIPKKDITPKTEVTPKKDITSKAEVTPKKDITSKTEVTPKKDEKKKVEDKMKDEAVDEEKQKSPSHKRKSSVEKKEEPQSKTRKIETAPRATPSAIVAALAAPSVFPIPPSVVSPPPQPPRVQQQVLRPPAPRAEIAPSPQATGATFNNEIAAFRAMTKEQVRDWVHQLTGIAEAGQKFEEEHIDGGILFDLTYDDLRNDLKITLGLAKKVRNEIDEIVRRSHME